MAQFDSLIVFPLIWSLLIILIFYDSISIEMLIPDFFGVKKFREKKSLSPSFSVFLKENSEVQRDSSYMTLF
jgi:hypothetical protein